MKWIKTIITILLLVIIAGVVWHYGLLEPVLNSNNVYDNNSVRFEYPEDWVEAKSVSEGSMAAVADPADPSTTVLIQQVPSEYTNDLQKAYAANNQYLTQQGNYIKVNELSTKINNRTAIVHRYITNEADGSQKEHVATWMKMKDGKLYVVLFSTPIETYEAKRSSYDTVVNSFFIITGQQDSSGMLGFFN